jgi:hypothetical protein
MHLTKKLAGILFGTLMAAGCTDATNVTSPDRTTPALDGLGWAGSGNRAEADSTSETSGESAAGIGWAGSGN